MLTRCKNHKMGELRVIVH